MASLYAVSVGSLNCRLVHSHLPPPRSSNYRSRVTPQWQIITKSSPYPTTLLLVNVAALATVIEESSSGRSDEEHARSISRADDDVAGKQHQADPLQDGNQGGNGTPDNDSQPQSGIMFKPIDDVHSLLTHSSGSALGELPTGPKSNVHYLVANARNSQLQPVTFTHA